MCVCLCVCTFIVLSLNIAQSDADKEHDTLIERVLPSANFEYVLTQLEIQLRGLDTHPFYKKDLFEHPDGWREWKKMEKKRVEDLVAALKKQHKGIVGADKLPESMEMKGYHLLFRVLFKSLFWMEAQVRWFHLI